jgi:DNA-binding MarR family transcriptional regulator
MTSKPKFYQVSVTTSKQLRSSGLTAAEWRIFAYLSELDPYGDRKEGVPFSPRKLMEECHVSKSTYFTAKAKLQKLGIFDFSECESTRITNLHSPKKQSEKLESQSEKLESQSEKLESQSEKLESQSEKLDTPIYNDPALDQTIQTYTDSKQTVTDPAAAVENSYQLPNNQNIKTDSTEILVENQEIDTFLVKNKDQDEDQYSGACNTLVTCNVVCEGEIMSGEVMEWGGDEVERGENCSITPLPHHPTTPSPENPLAIAVSEQTREKHKRINKIAYDFKKQPWRLDETTYHPNVFEAVFKSFPKRFSCNENSVTRNDAYIKKYLKNLESRMKGTDPLDAIACYDELMGFAVESTPEVKAVVEKIEDQRKEQKFLDEIEELRRMCETP